MLQEQHKKKLEAQQKRALARGTMVSKPPPHLDYQLYSTTPRTPASQQAQGTPRSGAQARDVEQPRGAVHSVVANGNGSASPAGSGSPRDYVPGSPSPQSPHQQQQQQPGSPRQGNDDRSPLPTSPNDRDQQPDASQTNTGTFAPLGRSLTRHASGALNLHRVTLRRCSSVVDRPPANVLWQMLMVFTAAVRRATSGHKRSSSNLAFSPRQRSVLHLSNLNVDEDDAKEQGANKANRMFPKMPQLALSASEPSEQTDETGQPLSKSMSESRVNHSPHQQQQKPIPDQSAGFRIPSFVGVSPEPSSNGARSPFDEREQQQAESGSGSSPGARRRATTGQLPASRSTEDDEALAAYERRRQEREREKESVSRQQHRRPRELHVRCVDSSRYRVM